uniref:IGFBP N-terminal domain-containing protein n=1 Tax=Branchiostoma floridae TaxID=7739 RepID=C3Z1U3_BRAFL|eukprot:XP_002597448.1 hypothetical protein BRAFLDRAFT_80546 [Branchiostoma floridae]
MKLVVLAAVLLCALSACDAAVDRGLQAAVRAGLLQAACPHCRLCSSRAACRRTIGKALCGPLCAVCRNADSPQAPPAQVFTKIFSNIPTLPKIAEYAMISTGTTICAVEAHMFFNRNKKTIETEDKSTSADTPARKAPTYPWIGVGPGYQQGW